MYIYFVWNLVRTTVLSPLLLNRLYFWMCMYVSKEGFSIESAEVYHNYHIFIHHPNHNCYQCSWGKLSFYYPFVAEMPFFIDMEVCFPTEANEGLWTYFLHFVDCLGNSEIIESYENLCFEIKCQVIVNQRAYLFVI